ncbi:unnamed protein product [Calicophoron daubneyi]|uniref:Uncharacterized protein n=1 Tax=Calicophoron daubneyi TaxID=300641 RepID=A0AAV2TLL3_CALDB
MLSRFSQVYRLCSAELSANFVRGSCSSTLYHTQSSRPDGTSVLSVRRQLSQLAVDEMSQADLLTKCLIEGNRRSLSQAITLVESRNSGRRRVGQLILNNVMRYLSDQEQKEGRYTLRVGLSGPPGAGKSTFIEAFGSRLTGAVSWNTSSASTSKFKCGCQIPAHVPNEKHRVAVLAVDPSSVSTGGSLLADKTRMPLLSANLDAYVRPSPSGGTLGGVARSTNEAVLLCEAAGYDIVLVETVGVGQSEFAVADMVDIFVLIIPPAGGDELQGIKRGIVEVADIVLVNKADGSLMQAARRIETEYRNAMHYQRQRREDWTPPVMLVSSFEGTGLSEFWLKVLEFKQNQLQNNCFQLERKKQMKVWMWNYIKEGMWANFKNHPLVRKKLPELEELVLSGALQPGPAAEELIELFSKT